MSETMNISQNPSTMLPVQPSEANKEENVDEIESTTIEVSLSTEEVPAEGTEGDAVRETSSEVPPLKEEDQSDEGDRPEIKDGVNVATIEEEELEEKGQDDTTDLKEEDERAQTEEEVDIELGDVKAQIKAEDDVATTEEQHEELSRDDTIQVKEEYETAEDVPPTEKEVEVAEKDITPQVKEDDDVATTEKQPEELSQDDTPDLKEADAKSQDVSQTEEEVDVELGDVKAQIKAEDDVATTEEQQEQLSRDDTVQVKEDYETAEDVPPTEKEEDVSANAMYIDVSADVQEDNFIQNCTDNVPGDHQETTEVVPESEPSEEIPEGTEKKQNLDLEVSDLVEQYEGSPEQVRTVSPHGEVNMGPSMAEVKGELLTDKLSLSEEEEEEVHPGRRRRVGETDDEEESEYTDDSSSHYSDAKGEETNKSGSSLRLPRESGDGAEEKTPDTAAKKDITRDKTNPCYVPRGRFYLHDDRHDEEKAENGGHQAAGKEQQERERRRGINADRWGHDMYNESEQMPISRSHLIRKYGYDIRADLARKGKNEGGQDRPHNDGSGRNRRPNQADRERPLAENDLRSKLNNLKNPQQEGPSSSRPQRDERTARQPAVAAEEEDLPRNNRRRGNGRGRPRQGVAESGQGDRRGLGQNESVEIRRYGGRGQDRQRAGEPGQAYVWQRGGEESGQGQPRQRAGEVGQGQARGRVDEVGHAQPRQRAGEVEQGQARGRVDEVGQGHPRQRAGEVGQGQARGRVDEVGQGQHRQQASEVGQGQAWGRVDEVGQGQPRQRVGEVDQGQPRQRAGDVGQGKPRQQAENIGQGQRRRAEVEEDRRARGGRGRGPQRPYEEVGEFVERPPRGGQQYNPAAEEMGRERQHRIPLEQASGRGAQYRRGGQKGSRGTGGSSGGRPILGSRYREDPEWAHSPSPTNNPIEDMPPLDDDDYPPSGGRRGGGRGVYTGGAVEFRNSNLCGGGVPRREDVSTPPRFSQTRRGDGGPAAGGGGAPKRYTAQRRDAPAPPPPAQSTPMVAEAQHSVQDPGQMLPSSSAQGVEDFSPLQYFPAANPAMFQHYAFAAAMHHHQQQYQPSAYPPVFYPQMPAHTGEPTTLQGPYAGQ